MLESVSDELSRLKATADRAVNATAAGGGGGGGGGSSSSSGSTRSTRALNQQQRRGLLMPSPPGTPGSPIVSAMAGNPQMAVLAQELAAMQKEEAALIAAEEAEIAAEEAALEAQLAAEARAAAGIGPPSQSTLSALYGPDVRRPVPPNASSALARTGRTWKSHSGLQAVHAALQQQQQAMKLPSLPPPYAPPK